MICAIVYQLTRNLTPEEIKRSGFAPYYVDHTTGLYPVAASGTPFSAETLQSTGDPIADLVEDLAAEQKARLTYDNILRLVDDNDVRDPIKFLRAREIVHFQRFGEGLRITQEQLDSRNFYAFNPAFDIRTANNRANNANVLGQSNILGASDVKPNSNVLGATDMKPNSNVLGASDNKSKTNVLGMTGKNNSIRIIEAMQKVVSPSTKTETAPITKSQVSPMTDMKQNTQVSPATDMKQNTQVSPAADKKPNTQVSPATDTTKSSKVKADSANLLNAVKKAEQAVKSAIKPFRSTRFGV
jgi:spore coat protein JC